MNTRLYELVAALSRPRLALTTFPEGTDVMETDPSPMKHSVWANVLLTPHMAGHGPYLNDRRHEIVAENCRRFAAGKELMNGVG